MSHECGVELAEDMFNVAWRTSRFDGIQTLDVRHWIQVADGNLILNVLRVCLHTIQVRSVSGLKSALFFTLASGVSPLLSTNPRKTETVPIRQENVLSV
jgi:hypothetical protein